MKLTIYGEPVAQGRPRFSTAGGFAKAYDPAKSRDYKDYIRLAAAEQVKGQAPLDGALIFGLKVYRAIPKGFSKKKADAAERGEIRPITKPDLGNYVKGIKDALRSICWHDDSQVVAYKEPFGKYYSEKPRIEIEVETLREKQERDKGCVWCKEDNKVFHDGQHFHFFCSYCGKRLEVEHELSSL